MRPQILLIDDDRVYGKILQSTAKKYHIQLDICQSFSDLAHLPSMDSYFGILIDYQLENMKGSTIAKFVDWFYQEVPVIMISSSSEWWLNTDIDRIPPCVKEFIHKDFQPKKILEEAIHRFENLDNDGAQPSFATNEAYEQFSQHVDSIAHHGFHHHGLRQELGDLIIKSAGLFSRKP